MTTTRHAALCLLLTATAPALGRTPIDMERPFDQYSWVTTHNAFTSNGAIANQSQTIASQLIWGVRGLMLDLHYDYGRVRLCHKVCTSDASVALADLLNDTILPFLASDPDAILTLQLEDFTQAAQLQAELAEAPGIGGLTFDPATWNTATWPTYRQLRDRGQRLLIFSLNEQNTGDFTIDGGVVHIQPSIEYTVENYWSLGMLAMQHDYSCQSRWGEAERPLGRRAIAGKPGWRPLFTMNHFHGVPWRTHSYSDNRFEQLSSRYLDHCHPVAGRKPNFVAVDFHEAGDVAKFAEWLTLSAPDEL